MSDTPPNNQPADTKPSETQPGDATAKGLTKEAGAVYAAALLLILGCVVVASAVPFVAQNLYALVAAVFIGLPYWWLSKHEMDFDRFGLTWDRAGRGVLWGLVLTVLTLGPFAVGYWWWETKVQEREYHFAVDNFFKWPVEYEGRPSSWGQDQGVWVWSTGSTLHVGLRADNKPVEVELEANEAFRPRVLGPATLRPPDNKDRAGEHQRWTVHLSKPHQRAEVLLGGHDAQGTPAKLRVRAKLRQSNAPVPIRQGAAAVETDASIDIERGLSWIVLWMLTQLVFIALPEEFFYRGYLQTRIKDILAARRKAHESTEEERRFLGISLPNVFASVLFAIGHVLVPVGGALIATRVAVFFPSLVFGWLRERTDTIAASVVYHAGANLMVLLAAPHFF